MGALSGCKKILWTKMKLLIAFFFAGLLVVSASTYSQQTRLSIKLDEVTVKEIFNQIEENSEFVFFYNEDNIDVYRKVSIDVKKRNVEDILNEVLEGTANTFKVYDRQIVILSPEVQELPPIIKSGSKTKQQRVVSGKVTDADGAPLPGVAIMVKGTHQGVSTDIDGNFSINITSEDAVLVFSYIGFIGQEIAVESQSSIHVTFIENVTGLEEVVVVGFGKQKKETVVGSITTIKPMALKTPSSNLSTSFAGRLAGVISVQRSGEPGNDNADFWIRGVSTFGANKSPLVFLDGVEISTGDLNRLDPEIIQNFSILKDASATALYGARGANGVILVETKRGKVGKPKISIRVENTFNKPTRLPEFTDAVNYMEMFNEARLNSGVDIPRYSADNPNPNAFYPRLTETENKNNTAASSWWLRDGSFMRLKDAEVGYSLNNKVRLFVSGRNLLTFSKFKLWDPEMGGGNGLGYPPLKNLNIGAQLNF